jgi:hypothetical protein
MALKADYKDDMFAGDRKYRMAQNTDGTVKIEDVTTYTQNGDKFGANDINATNKAINGLMSTKEFVLPAAKWSSTAPYTQEVTVAGVTASDTPIISLNTAPHLNDAAYVKNMKKQCSYIDYIETLDGKIKAYCLNKKPSIDIPCMLKGV